MWFSSRKKASHWKFIGLRCRKFWERSLHFFKLITYKRLCPAFWIIKHSVKHKCFKKKNCFFIKREVETKEKSQSYTIDQIIAARKMCFVKISFRDSWHLWCARPDAIRMLANSFVHPGGGGSCRAPRAAPRTRQMDAVESYIMHTLQHLTPTLTFFDLHIPFYTNYFFPVSPFIVFFFWKFQCT